MGQVAYNQKSLHQSSIQLLCAVIFLVANVFGTELDCWFMFVTPYFLYSCSVFTGLAVLTFLWLHVGPYSTGRWFLLQQTKTLLLASLIRNALRCKSFDFKGTNNFNRSRSRLTALVLNFCSRPLCLWLEVLSAFYSLKFFKWQGFSDHLNYTFQKTHLRLNSLNGDLAQVVTVIFTLNLYKQDNQSWRITVLKRNLLVLCIAFRICFTTC